MSGQWSPDVLNLLRKAGWYAGRSSTKHCQEVECFPLFETADAVLTEFGGLHIGDCGPGINCGTSDVDVYAVSLEHMEAEIRSHELSVRERLFPVAEFHRAHGYLLIDESGRIYHLSAVSDDFGIVAETFPKALEALLLGRKV